MSVVSSVTKLKNHAECVILKNNTYLYCYKVQCIVYIHTNDFAKQFPSENLCTYCIFCELIVTSHCLLLYIKFM